MGETTELTALEVRLALATVDSATENTGTTGKVRGAVVGAMASSGGGKDTAIGGSATGLAGGGMVTVLFVWAAGKVTSQLSSTTGLHREGGKQVRGGKEGMNEVDEG